MNSAEIRKEEVEEMLGMQIEDSLFRMASQYAVKKRDYIYKQEKREVVKQRWYLLQLTQEYVRNLIFSDYTFALCMAQTGTKKENQAIGLSSPTHTNIVSVQPV